MEEFKRACTILEEEFMSFYYNDKISTNKRLREVARRFLTLLALKTGMRRSELFGLARSDEYNDLDLENATFDVNKSRHYVKGVGKQTQCTKNESSIRIKSLPKSILPYLKLYYDLLDSLDYKEPFIFDFLSIDSTSGDWFDTWQSEHHIRDIRFHDLRHSYAVAAIRSGDDIKTVQGNLGHATAAFTLDVYGHVTDQMKQASAARMQKYIENIVD